MALLSVSVLTVGFMVITEDTAWFKKYFNHGGAVMGAQIRLDQMPLSENLLIDYQNKLLNDLSAYLKRRAEFNSAHRDWLIIIQQTKRRLLEYTVPAPYAQLHLTVVLALDNDYRAVYLSDENLLRQANLHWEKILSDYFWLNQ